MSVVLSLHCSQACGNATKLIVWRPNSITAQSDI